MKSMLRSSEQSSKAAVSKALRESFRSDEMIDELALGEQRCLEALEGKMKRLSVSWKQISAEQLSKQREDTVDMITKIVSATIIELEKDLTHKLEAKAEEMRDQMQLAAPTSNSQDIEALQESIASMKNELTLLTEKAQQSSQIDSVSDKLIELEKRMNSLHTSQASNDADVMRAFDFLSQHKDALKDLQQKAISKAMVEQMIDEKDTNIFNQSDDFVDQQTFKKELDTLRSEFLEKSAKQRDVYASGLQNLEARAVALEDDMKRRLNAVLDIVESFEHRVQGLEVDSISKEALSDLQETMALYKSELPQRINDELSQSKADISLLRNDITILAEKLGRIETRVNNGVLAHEVDVRKHAFVNNDEDNLARKLSELHTTLIDATGISSRSQLEPGHDNKVQSSVVSILASQQQQQQQQPVITSPAPRAPTAEDVMSPCVHLMGLGSPGSITSAGSLSPKCPQESLLQNNVEESGVAGEDKFSPCSTGEIACTPRSESSSTAVGSISTSDAISLCGDVDVSAGSCAFESSTPSDVSTQSGKIDSSSSPEDLDERKAARSTSNSPFLEASNIKSPTDDLSTILGSIASFDEAESVSSPSGFQESSTRHGLVAINTVDLDVYERWEHVLTEFNTPVSKTQGDKYDAVSESTNLYESSFESEG
jgi:hypothetical protein